MYAIWSVPSWEAKAFGRYANILLGKKCAYKTLFSWRKLCDEPEMKYCGVALNAYWVLQPEKEQIVYEAHAAAEHQERDFDILLRDYLRADFDLEAQQAAWVKADKKFTKFVGKPVRILSQEPLENIICFMCSQNNNIKR